MNIYLIAGEPSGDQLGARLIEALTKIDDRPKTFLGVGGDKMQAAGLGSLFPMEEVAVMGLAEVLPHAMHIKKRIRQTAEDILEKKPDILVTIDAPGFTHRVVKKLKAKGYAKPIVHYVAPSVWAWKPGRAKRLAGLVDHLMVLLPFEPPYFEAHNLATTFVGHAVLGLGLQDTAPEDFLKKYKLDGYKKIVTLMPGSRRGEITRHLPVFLRVAQKLCLKNKDTHFIIPTLPHLETHIKTLCMPAPGGLSLTVITEDKHAALKASALVLTASGTASVEVAAAGVPQVVGYKINGLSYALARPFIKVDYASIVNLLEDHYVIPEFIQKNFTVENLYAEAVQLLENVSHRKAQLEGCQCALNKLAVTEAFPGEAAAKIILNVA